MIFSDHFKSLGVQDYIARADEIFSLLPPQYRSSEAAKKSSSRCPRRPIRRGIPRNGRNFSRTVSLFSSPRHMRRTESFGTTHETKKQSLRDCSPKTCSASCLRRLKEGKCVVQVTSIYLISIEGEMSSFKREMNLLESLWTAIEARLLLSPTER